MPNTLHFDPEWANLPDLLTLCDCPWHPCSHNGPKRDWRFHLFGRFAIGPTAPGQRHAPRARGVWRRIGSVLPVAPKPEDGCGDCTPEGNHPCRAGCRDALRH